MATTTFANIRASELGSKDRIGSLDYIKPTSKLNRRYVAPGAEINTGQYESRNVIIRDGRNIQAKFAINKTGFFLANHHSKVNDWTDVKQVEDMYTPEIHKFISDLTGSDKAIVFGPVVRRAKAASVLTGNPNEQPPASDVHVDFTPRRAQALADDFLGKHGAGGYSYKRFMFINMWRAISPGPQDWPLAVCNGASVKDEEGVANGLVYTDTLPDRNNIPAEVPHDPMYPEGTIFVYNPSHEWFYFSDMTKDELLVFRLFDSEKEKGWRVPHCSFHNNEEGAVPRQSVEIRAVLYFK
ncbi:hypothetical protein BKA64DRAFT_345020 [Cadophora sp. MPI-SDFR-AT-0126]|nr:hypothetical protein BKA64DRAFT_345020 [Leotiomycetes sp. MPI-SDFR-AT-0126]